MTAAGLDRRVLQIRVHCLLLLHHCGHRLERHAKINRLPVRNTALDPAGPVGRCVNLAGLCSKRVIVLCAGQQDSGKAGPDVEALRSGKTKHCLGEIGLEPVKNRFPPAWRHPARNAFHNPAHGIPLLPHMLD